jgi:hypothetical protein
MDFGMKPIVRSGVVTMKECPYLQTDPSVNVILLGGHAKFLLLQPLFISFLIFFYVEGGIKV